MSNDDPFGVNIQRSLLEEKKKRKKMFKALLREPLPADSKQKIALALDVESLETANNALCQEIELLKPKIAEEERRNDGAMVVFACLVTGLFVHFILPIFISHFHDTATTTFATTKPFDFK